MHARAGTPAGLDVPGSRVWRQYRNTLGLSLLEVVVALGIFAVALAGLAPVLIQCTTLLVDARDETRALELATSRLEQLRGLPFEQDATSLALRTDTLTNFARDPPALDGSGLRAATPASAWLDLADRFDVVTAQGYPPSGPGDAPFIRRWAVVDLSNGAADRLLIQVFARDVVGDRRIGARASPAHRPGDVWLFTIRARGLR